MCSHAPTRASLSPPPAARFGASTGQGANLSNDQREAPTRLTCMGGFQSGVKRENFGLKSNVVN